MRTLVQLASCPYACSACSLILTLSSGSVSANSTLSAANAAHASPSRSLPVWLLLRMKMSRGTSKTAAAAGEERASAERGRSGLTAWSALAVPIWMTSESYLHGAIAAQTWRAWPLLTVRLHLSQHCDACRAWAELPSLERTLKLACKCALAAKLWAMRLVVELCKSKQLALVMDTDSFVHIAAMAAGRRTWSPL